MKNSICNPVSKEKGMTRYIRACALLIVLGMVACVAGGETVSLDKIKLPPGFRIAVYASGVRNARQMALGSNGTLFVGSKDVGSVYAVVDRDKDNRADEVIKIASGLNMPSGLAF